MPIGNRVGHGTNHPQGLSRDRAAQPLHTGLPAAVIWWRLSRVGKTSGESERVRLDRSFI